VNLIIAAFQAFLNNTAQEGFIFNVKYFNAAHSFRKIIVFP
jgi:hypothetical protein